MTIVDVSLSLLALSTFVYKDRGKIQIQNQHFMKMPNFTGT